MDEKKEKVRDRLIEDCFGNVAGRMHCHILTEDVCLYGKCSFYKTRAQYESDRKKYENASNISCVHNGRQVRCVERGKVYPSVRAASRELGISESAISMVLRGKQKTTYGMRFQYV